jgi:competence protein ComEA
VALILVVVVGSFVAPAIGARDGGDTPVGAGVEDAGPEGVTWETPAASEPPEEAEGSAVVHVAGAVAAPGVYTLPAGARVIDAVDQAGGASPEADLGALNLAAPVRDGERIYVPLPGETPPAVLGSDVSGPSAGGSSGETGASGLVPVNTATAEELTALPGIGPVLAQRIVDFREAHGPFDALGDLGEVSGIGPKILASLADAVSF